MKRLLALVLSFISLSTFAAGSGAVEKFITFLPLGTYDGATDKNEKCHVVVEEVNFPKKDIQVTISNTNREIKKLIEENSQFGFKDYKREFVQTERKFLGDDEYNYVERIVRTVSAGDKKQYVVVSYSVAVNTKTNTEIAECVVDL